MAYSVSQKNMSHSSPGHGAVTHEQTLGMAQKRHYGVSQEVVAKVGEGFWAPRDMP